MGQKVNPISFRLGINQACRSDWCIVNKVDYSNSLHEDISIRAYVKKHLSSAGISKVVIQRTTNKVIIILHSSRPGVLIGKKGADIDKLKTEVSKIVAGEVFINIVEVKKPEIDAQLIAESVAQQLEKRIAFRRAMKRAIQSCMKVGGLGIKISCSGRLGGAEIARTEWYKEGRVPLHTLKANIDFGMARANTTYGVIGVTVHVYKGDSFSY